MPGTASITWRTSRRCANAWDGTTDERARAANVAPLLLRIAVAIAAWRAVALGDVFAAIIRGRWPECLQFHFLAAVRTRGGNHVHDDRAPRRTERHGEVHQAVGIGISDSLVRSEHHAIALVVQIEFVALDGERGALPSIDNLQIADPG